MGWRREQSRARFAARSARRPSGSARRLNTESNCRPVDAFAQTLAVFVCCAKPAAVLEDILRLHLPPVRPSHLGWCPGCPNNGCLLIRGEPPVTEPGKCLLDQPRFEHYPGARPEAVELRCHSQPSK